jgi:hypothetical protein
MVYNVIFPIRLLMISSHCNWIQFCCWRWEIIVTKKSRIPLTWFDIGRERVTVKFILLLVSYTYMYFNPNPNPNPTCTFIVHFHEGSGVQSVSNRKYSVDAIYYFNGCHTFKFIMQLCQWKYTRILWHEMISQAWRTVSHREIYWPNINKCRLFIKILVINQRFLAKKRSLTQCNNY